MQVNLLFLGTGTSTGVPQVGCNCPTCRSIDPADRRLRASALVDADGKSLLIDCGPDLRQQLLVAGAPRIDALLLTHSHYDHVGGIDDLRPYCIGEPLPTYCTADVAADLRSRVPYCFAEKLYPGVPTFDLRIITPGRPFKFQGLDIVPLPVMHYKLPIVGYRIGPLAYITDCKTMPDSTLKLLSGVDTLVLNALRIEPHMSHLSLSESIAIAQSVGARQTYFTHMSHQIGPECTVRLPATMHLAHDFLSIKSE